MANNTTNNMKSTHVILLLILAAFMLTIPSKKVATSSEIESELFKKPDSIALEFYDNFTKYDSNLDHAMYRIRQYTYSQYKYVIFTKNPDAGSYTSVELTEEDFNAYEKTMNAVLKYQMQFVFETNNFPNNEYLRCDKVKILRDFRKK